MYTFLYKTLYNYILRCERSTMLPNFAVAKYNNKLSLYTFNIFQLFCFL